MSSGRIRRPMASRSWRILGPNRVHHVRDCLRATCSVHPYASSAPGPPGRAGADRRGWRPRGCGGRRSTRARRRLGRARPAARPRARPSTRTDRRGTRAPPAGAAEPPGRAASPPARRRRARAAARPEVEGPAARGSPCPVRDASDHHRAQAQRLRGQRGVVHGDREVLDRGDRGSAGRRRGRGSLRRGDVLDTAVVGAGHDQERALLDPALVTRPRPDARLGSHGRERRRTCRSAARTMSGRAASPRAGSRRRRPVAARRRRRAPIGGEQRSGSYRSHGAGWSCATSCLGRPAHPGAQSRRLAGVRSVRRSTLTWGRKARRPSNPALRPWA